MTRRRATVFPYNADSFSNGAIPLRVTTLAIDPDFERLPTVVIWGCVCGRGPTFATHGITDYVIFTSEDFGFLQDIDLRSLTSGIL